jgi:DNA-binding YbaB/EbfC family protein
MNLGDLFKQARDFQAKTQELQTALAAIEVEGVSGAGLVRLTMSGKGELKRVAIDPSLVKPEDRETIEDLVVAAHSDAKGKLERRVAEEMQKIAGALGLPPGLGFPV